MTLKDKEINFNEVYQLENKLINNMVYQILKVIDF